MHESTCFPKLCLQLASGFISAVLNGISLMSVVEQLFIYLRALWVYWGGVALPIHGLLPISYYTAGLFHLDF